MSKKSTHSIEKERDFNSMIMVIRVRKNTIKLLKK